MLIRHSLLYILSKLLPGVLGIATTSLLTRLLTPAQYGRYGLALVVMTFGATIAFDWLGLTYLRVAPSREDRRASESTFLIMFLALFVVTFVLAALAVATGVVRAEQRPIFVAGLLMMWSYAAFEFATRLHISELRPSVYLRMNVGRALLSLVSGGSAAYLTRDPVWTAYAMAFATTAGACLGGAGRHGLAWTAFDLSLARTVLSFGVPLAASLALNSATGSGTRALVGWLGGIDALGLYTAAFVLVQNSLTVISSGLASAGFALAVRAVESGNAEAARRQIEANGNLLLAVLAPASVGMALTAHAIATTLVGSQYAATVAQLTPCMAAGAFFAGFRAHFLDHAFQLGHRTHGQVWVTAGSATVTASVALWLIPRFGPWGGAIAVTAGAAVSMVHALVAGRTAYKLPLPWRCAGRVAVACMVMAACVSAMPVDGVRGLVARAAVGIVAYAVAAVLLDILGVRAPALAWLPQRSKTA